MSQSPIPRHYVFVLQSGACVVRLPNARIFDIISSQESPYNRRDFGHAITDGELQNLKASGYVLTYDGNWVTLVHDLPDTASGSERVRACYIATTLPANRFNIVRDALSRLQTSRFVHADVRDDSVVVLGPGATPFTDLNDAEIVLQQLQDVAPQLFEAAFVSMYEVAVLSKPAEVHTGHPTLFPGAGQLAGRKVFVVGLLEEHRAVEHLLRVEMQMDVKIFEDGASALMSFEVEDVAVAIVDLALPDMHGWAFIQKLRERPKAANLPGIVVSDDSADVVMALKIARVTGFMPRPLNLTKLRDKIWMALQVGTSEQ